MPLPSSKSQIERLGVRLVRDRSEASVEDRAGLHSLLLAYDEILEESVALVRARLDLAPTSRIKNTGTILEKLDRYGGSWLKSIQDIAGMRIVGTFDRAGQDAVVAGLVDLFGTRDGERRPKVVDRRETPSHGYAAVHVIVFPRGAPVEIQVRTRLQHEWAELFEKLADLVGRGIRYGEPPQHWLPFEARKFLAPARRDRYERAYESSYEAMTAAVEVGLILADAIAALEHAERLERDNPELGTLRLSVETTLGRFSALLDRIEHLRRMTTIRS